MHPILRTAVLAAGFVVVHTAAAQPDMRPGLWETTIRTEMSGMPTPMPPVTNRQCIRAEDVVPRVQGSDQQCRVVDQKTAGNTVSWRIQCDDSEMNMAGRGEITYAGESYRGRIDIETDGGPMGPMTMTQRLEGRRVGDCP